MTRRIIVTGAAGFIGSHLCDTLLDQGHNVGGVDSFTDFYTRARKESNLASALLRPDFQLIAGDLLSLNLQTLLSDADVVFHLAGQPGVRGSWGKQFEVYARNNVLVTQRLLEASLAAGGIPVVYASSSSAYGNLTHMPLREDMSPAPVSPYGVTKLAGEYLCRLYAEVYGLPTLSLRLFTVYGPRQRPDMAFQRFLAAIHGDQEIVIYGDGQQSRDFTYVADVVQAMLAAAAAVQAGRHAGEVFNVAGGSRATINEVLAEVAAVTQRRPRVHYVQAQPGDVRETWADTTAVRAALGYSPVVSLREGLALQWQHMQSEPERTTA